MSSDKREEILEGQFRVSDEQPANPLASRETPERVVFVDRTVEKIVEKPVYVDRLVETPVYIRELPTKAPESKDMPCLFWVALVLLIFFVAGLLMALVHH